MEMMATQRTLVTLIKRRLSIARICRTMMTLMTFAKKITKNIEMMATQITPTTPPGNTRETQHQPKNISISV